MDCTSQDYVRTLKGKFDKILLASSLPYWMAPFSIICLRFSFLCHRKRKPHHN